MTHSVVEQVRLAHLGQDQTTLKVRLSAKDAASIKKLAKVECLSVSDMVRVLIRRARTAGRITR